MWTSIQNKSYCALTTHFIDSKWKMIRTILNFSHLKLPHTAKTKSKFLLYKLLAWNLDKKMMCLALHNCSTNDKMIKIIMERIPTSSLFLDEKLYHVRCTSHILNLIVLAGVDASNEVTMKIREIVRYVRFRQLDFTNFRYCLICAIQIIYGFMHLHSKLMLWYSM